MNIVSIVTKLVVVGIVGFFLVIFYSLFSGKLEHPELELRGLWKEVEWTYEKVDRSRGSSAVQKDELRERMKNQITKDLIIHKSENWEFTKDGKLFLTKENNKRDTLDWYMKGRGHILKLKHSNGALEFYQIRELDSEQMVLHFENDNHARGIVKIIFKKIRD